VLITLLSLTPLAAWLIAKIIAPALTVYPEMIAFAIGLSLGCFAERRCARWTTKAKPLGVKPPLGM